MPRPVKRRNVCCLPKVSNFFPEGYSSYAPDKSEGVILTVDEYEAIRFIDYEGLSQEVCSSYMGIARTTVQLIYARARKKVACALVEGLPLKIDGGDYRVCNGQNNYCNDKLCLTFQNNHHHKDKESAMIVAIPLEKDKVSICPAFGRTPYFLFHNLKTGEEEIKDNPAKNAEGGAGVRAAQFIIDNAANCVIAQRLGGNADAALKAAKILVYEPHGSEAAQNIDAFKNDELSLLYPFRSSNGRAR